MSQSTWWQVLAVVITILVGSISIITTIFIVAWKLRGYFGTIEIAMEQHKAMFQIEMSANREVMIATNRRLQRLEDKLDVNVTDKYKAS